MQKQRQNLVIIDGYNLIHKMPSLKKRFQLKPEDARNGLFAYCAEWLATRKDVSLFYIVFDGQSNINPHGHTPQPASGIKVFYTQTNEKADTRILDIISERNSDCNITVVSDDNFVINGSKSLGAKTMSTSNFTNTPFTPKTRNPSRKSYAGDKNLTPSKEKEINDSLRQEWNID